MPWLRHLALFVVFVFALLRPAAAGAFVHEGIAAAYNEDASGHVLFRSGVAP